MKILHYGLQRSGTNFLETLLKKNYQVNFLNINEDRESPLQKHFRLYDHKDIIPHPDYRNNILVENFQQFESLCKFVPDYYLIISKDPYSWYLSYKKWAQKCNWPQVSHHYIEEYNLFYSKFLSFSSQSEKLIFIRYIDLLKDTDTVLAKLATRMKLQKKFLSRFSFTMPQKVAQSSKFTEQRLFYYINEKYLEEYSDEDLQTLNKLLDTQVISLLGYEQRLTIK